MSKGLEAFNKFCDDVDACVNSGGIHYIDMRNKEVIEKELKEGENYKVMYRLEHEKNQQLSQANLKMSKALEIIKNHLSEQVANIESGKPQKCLLMLIMENEEEYNLLKEVNL